MQNSLKIKSNVIFYASVNDLCLRLEKLHAAKKGGNNGYDNIIHSILDELMRVPAIPRNKYIFHKNIFPTI